MSTMSSPRSVGGQVREGTRVVLREITATLHNSSPVQSPRRKGGNDNSLQKTAEHEVKVRFAREFADVGSITYSAPESLSSASSFHSLSSTLSTKSSSGICPDSVPQSPNETPNVSYVNASIAGVEDLISACADIQLDSDEERSFNALQNTQDLSQDQTFASANDEPVGDLTRDFPIESSGEGSQNVTQVIETTSETHDTTCSTLNRTQDIQERPILGTICIRDISSADPHVSNSDDATESKAEVVTEELVSQSKSIDVANSPSPSNLIHSLEENSLPDCNTENGRLNSTVCLSPNEANPDVIKTEEEDLIEHISITDAHSSNLALCSTLSSIPSTSALIENVECPSLPSISTISFTDQSGQILIGTSNCDTTQNVESLLHSTESPTHNISTTVSPSSEDVLKSSTTEVKENKSSSDLEAVECNSCELTNDEENCTNVLDVTPTATQISAEIQKNLELEIQNQSEVVNENPTLNEIDASPETSDTLPTNAPTTNQENDLWIGEEIKFVELAVIEKLESSPTADPVSLLQEEEVEGEEEQSSDDKLDSTLTLEDAVLHLEDPSEIEQYTEFKPQRQSTTLVLPSEQGNFDALKSAAEQVANDIFKNSLELPEESDRFISATSEIFQDPTSFDFLLARSSSKTINRLRQDSLYVKFDPLVGDTSMLPQGNTQPLSEEQNGKNDTSLPNVGTPKRNPAIAAIDRLLFYSPLPSGTVQKTEKPQEKIEQPVEESKPDAALIADINMSKELELVRATVLQLEEELEKQKKEYEAELEKEKLAFQERINKLQTQIAQEVKSKSQMTVVVEEYEKSISRLLTERERDRTNFEQEKTKVQEELQAANVHLTNTEAAFNDVHQKYERLKGVVSAYKSNEAVLKESIQENMETIKGLETRYEQLKNHAMAQLEKANFELDAIRKQHEDETVKLHAMVRKAELKSNSLAELVEQKTKENKELAQILDEVIARVGHQNAE